MSICRVGEDTFKKYLKIQILYTQTYRYTDRLMDFRYRCILDTFFPNPASEGLIRD